MRPRLADLLCGLVATWLAAYSALVGAMLQGWWTDPPGQLNRYFVLVFLLIYAALFLLVFSPLLIALGLGAGCAWPLVRVAATRRARAARGAILGIVVAAAGAAVIVAMSPREHIEPATEGPPVPVRRAHTRCDSLVTFATRAAGLSPFAAISFSICAWRTSPGVRGKRIAGLEPFGPDC
jgi:hypothetical protein